MDTLNLQLRMKQFPLKENQKFLSKCYTLSKWENTHIEMSRKGWDKVSPWTPPLEQWEAISNELKTYGFSLGMKSLDQISNPRMLRIHMRNGPPKLIALEINRSCVHETQQTIEHKERVRNWFKRFAVAIPLGLSIMGTEKNAHLLIFPGQTPICIY